MRFISKRSIFKLPWFKKGSGTLRLPFLKLKFLFYYFLSLIFSRGSSNKQGGSNRFKPPCNK